MNDNDLIIRTLNLTKRMFKEFTGQTMEFASEILSIEKEIELRLDKEKVPAQAESTSKHKKEEVIKPEEKIPENKSEVLGF